MMRRVANEAVVASAAGFVTITTSYSIRRRPAATSQTSCCELETRSETRSQAVVRLAHRTALQQTIYTVSHKKSSKSYFAKYFRAGLTDCKKFNGYRVRDNQ